MIKFAGHTMGTPYHNLRGSMRLFSRIGFDGIEIRCALDGQLDTEQAPDEYVQKVKEWCAEYRIRVACLTPYYRDFTSARGSQTLARMKRVVDIAADLGCQNVRVYGGMDPASPGLSMEDNRHGSVQGIRELAGYAADLGVRLCVETHIGSLTYTAGQAAAFVEEIGRENVGVLLDYAWVYLAGEESIEEVFTKLDKRIFHCHVKDWKISDRSIPSNNTACLLGQGDIPWHRFLNALKASGYDGWISDEYEKYWHAEDLPPAREGMRANISFLRGALG